MASCACERLAQLGAALPERAGQRLERADALLEVGHRRVPRLPRREDRRQIPGIGRVDRGPFGRQGRRRGGHRRILLAASRQPLAASDPQPSATVVVRIAPQRPRAPRARAPRSGVRRAPSAATPRGRHAARGSPSSAATPRRRIGSPRRSSDRRGSCRDFSDRAVLHRQRRTRRSSRRRARRRWWRRGCGRLPGAVSTLTKPGAPSAIARSRSSMP